MKTHPGIVKEAHAEFDRRWSKLLREQNACVSCIKGCHHCCSEPVMVNVAEARLALASVPPAELAVVVERTKLWLDKILPTGLLAVPEPHVIPWLHAGAVCPLLKDGLCLVYESRPFGCRYHTALDNPALCASPDTRLAQRYANSQELGEFIGLLLLRASPRMGNLGVFLARWLLKLPVPCAADFTVPVTTSVSSDGTVLNVHVTGPDQRRSS